MQQKMIAMVFAMHDDLGTMSRLLMLRCTLMAAESSNSNDVKGRK